jgi:anti-sigma regulatory factor (Ser/Thr protein kinase)
LEVGEIEVAFGEAVNNAILYGSPHPDNQIDITCCLRRVPSQPAALIIQIRDRGRGFDPETVVKGDLGTDALGGRGIGLMCALMDEVCGFHDGTGMVIRMARTLPQGAEVPSPTP